MKSKSQTAIELNAGRAPVHSFPLVSNFTFAGEMHLEGMHEQENAFFDELLRENDLSLEDVEFVHGRYGWMTEDFDLETPEEKAAMDAHLNAMEELFAEKARA
jgi:hypothetical protein